MPFLTEKYLCLVDFYIKVRYFCDHDTSRTIIICSAMQLPHDGLQLQLKKKISKNIHQNKRQGWFLEMMNHSGVNMNWTGNFQTPTKRGYFGILIRVTTLPDDFFPLISFSVVGFFFLEKTFALSLGLSFS